MRLVNYYSRTVSDSNHPCIVPSSIIIFFILVLIGLFPPSYSLCPVLSCKDYSRPHFLFLKSPMCWSPQFHPLTLSRASSRSSSNTRIAAFPKKDALVCIRDWSLNNLSTSSGTHKNDIHDDGTRHRAIWWTEIGERKKNLYKFSHHSSLITRWSTHSLRTSRCEQNILEQ